MSDARMPRSVDTRTLRLGDITLTIHVLDDGRRVVQSDGMNAFIAAQESGQLNSDDAMRVIAWMKGDA